MIKHVNKTLVLWSIILLTVMKDLKLKCQYVGY
jgi:hypothetical protein